MINCHLVAQFSAPLATTAKVRLLAVPRVGEVLVVKMEGDLYQRFVVNAVGYQCEDVSHTPLHTPLESFVLLEVTELSTT